MIERDTLLFPDTGPEFLQTLRSAVFYSERVRTLTFFDYGLAEVLSEAFRERSRDEPHGIDHRDPPLVERLRTYFQFVQSIYPEIELLHQEGAWQPLQVRSSDTSPLGLNEVNEVRLNALQQWSAREDRSEDGIPAPAFPPEVAALLDSAFDAAPPSYGDLVLMGAAIKRLRDNATDLDMLFRDTDTSCRIAYLNYLLTLSLLAERQALTPLSWDPLQLDALATARGLLPTRGQLPSGSPLAKRESAQIRLAQVAVERHLPGMDDLPSAELLEIKRRRIAELDAFRVGARSLATQVDVTKSRNEVDLQIRDLVTRHIDPAVRDLDAALTASRLEVFSKLGSAWKAGAGAAVPAIISFAVGAPLELTAAIAAIAGLGMPILDANLQQRKLTEGSQWSFLWRLSKSSHG